MANSLLTRVLITLTVSTISLFFKIKQAKVNRIFKTVYRVRGEKGIVDLTPTRQSDYAKKIVAGLNYARCNKCPDWRAYEHEFNFNYFLVEQEAKSKLPQVDRYVRFYYRFFQIFYWYLLVKNICRCALAHETFASWRYIDCFLPGRVTLNGRMIEMVPYFVCFETAGWLLWCYTIENLIKEIKMPCVEFLLSSSGNEPYWQKAESSYSMNYAQERMDRSYHSTLLEYQNPFTARRGHTLGPLYKIRPNRTRASWHSLAQITNWCYGGAILSCLLFTPTFFRMFLPVVLTKRGFEFNYRMCIEWIATTGRIRAHNSTGSRSHSLWDTIADEVYNSIWLPKVEGSKLGVYTKPIIIHELFMPWVDLVSPSYFQLLRATCDMLESILLFVTLGLSFNSICFISVLVSRDILIYCQSVNVRLKRLINMSAQSGTTRARARLLRIDTADVQAQIADLFAMLDSYNKYMSIQCVSLLMFWIGYSAMVSSWIFMPDNVGSKVEWYSMHAIATAYFFTMLSNMSKVRSSCHKMNELMSSAMAHASDNDNIKDNEDNSRLGECGCAQASKKIWLSLLRFYAPRPLHCFTIINSIELTVMSGLQLLAWLFGAIVIASSFFQVHNIK